MKNILCLLLILFFSSQIWSQEELMDEIIPVTNADTPVLTSDISPEVEDFNPRKSHWIFSFGFEGFKYPTFNDYSGAKKSFSPKDEEYWGIRLGFGGEIYLGAGFLTTTRIEGYFAGTLFSQVLNGGAEDSDVKFAYTKKTGQIYGADVSQALGFVFNMKTKNPIMDEWAYLTVEPYVEAGIGQAWAYNRMNYSYDLDVTDESYRLTVKDQLLNAKIAYGINFTSRGGYFLSLKMTQNRFNISERKAKEIVDAGASTNPDFGDKIDVITTYSIGGGYKF